MSTSAERKQQIIDEIQSQLAIQNFSALLAKLNNKCFTKCVAKPGSKLDSSEQTCIAKCSDRYQEAWNIVSIAYLRRMQQMEQMKQAQH
ncbi:Tim10/DDP family zinc finger-domain-containing protein [Polychytrium aggregatum]|uniref:Tim10/DDP family zinc finger-domain-containing protein n=1 Tax=Polychytrium aggregatum TaxID=110093 RepID=UPI0022FE7CC7|nr:Tim10/DDP family zinc finger-domain-containing protein [Polychytrium aggregatum]KAI9206516.1 Tim10/DDP family zinc finger-domain-containing protein [Polychytrium aggregatum]